MRYAPFLLLAFVTLTACQPMHGPVLMHPSGIHSELAADSVVIPMTLVDGRVLVNATLDGKGPFPFVFDTGAHGNVMDLSLARELGMTLGQGITVGSPGGGGRPGYQVTIGTMQIGGLTLSQVTSVAFDGLPFPPGGDSPRGVLGPYGLNGLLVTLDYPQKRLVFRRGALPAPDGRDVFGWDRNRGLPEVPGTVGGRPVALHLDSGASVAVTLPTDLADRLPLDGPLVDMGFAKTVDQVIEVRGARLAGTFTVGRYALANPTLRFMDMAKGVGNVGAAILSQFAITIDPANARLQLAGPVNGQLAVTEPRKPRYGLQLRALGASPLHVVGVDAGSPAEKAGLRASDDIVRINDRPIQELALDDRLAALKSSPLHVTLQRGDVTMQLTMTLE